MSRTAPDPIIIPWQRFTSPDGRPFAVARVRPPGAERSLLVSCYPEGARVMVNEDPSTIIFVAHLDCARPTVLETVCYAMGVLLFGEAAA